MKLFSLVLLTVSLLIGCEEKTPPTQEVSKQADIQEQAKPITLKEKVDASYKKAADWLVSMQDKSGAWKAGNAPSVGYTAMVTYALAGAKSHQQSIDMAVAFLLKSQSEDGSFSDFGSNKTYITSVTLMALAEADKTKYAGSIKRAQDFLVGAHVKSGIYRGGSGYGDVEIEFENGKPKREVSQSADLSNTGFAIEALKASGLPEDSDYWKDAVSFLTRCQNFSETNNDPELMAFMAKAGIKPGNDGGFYYGPDTSKAGEQKEADGSSILRSYGSMTYSGIKSFLYAKVGKDDPRVKAAIDWISRNYTVDMHPGFPVDQKTKTHLQGLFYYYMVFAKAFDVLGDEEFTTADGKKHKWAEDLANKLISIQTAVEGKAWQNEMPRWGEGDPALAASYCLISYNIINKWLKSEAGDFESITRQGIERLKAQKYNEAIKLFDKAIELDSKNRLAYWAYWNRGDAKYALGDYKGAIEDWQMVEQVGFGTVSIEDPIPDKIRQAREKIGEGDKKK